MMRVHFERACRVTALLCLAVALVLSLQASRDRARTASRVMVRLSTDERGDSAAVALAALRDAVVEGAARGAADTLVLSLDVLPASDVRAALGSMYAARLPLQWRDSTSARGLAVSVSRAAAPGAPLTVRMSGSPSTPSVLRDAGGVLDSVAPNSSGTMSWQLQSATAPLRAQQRGSSATATLPGDAPSRRLFVLGDPGWESKFVVAALEEGGWSVDGTFRISPTGTVVVGVPQKLDTARYAAVIVLDSMAVDAAALTRFVARGGGLVLGGDALRMPSLAALRPARAIERRGGIAGALLTDAPRRGLEAWEVQPSIDAVLLQVDTGDHAHAEPAMLARRVEAGRVVAMPYRDTWRWRMQGSDAGADEHRAWWNSAVMAAVPSIGAAPVTEDVFPGAAAPYADLVARIGAPTAIPATSREAAAFSRTTGSDRSRPLQPILFCGALLLLLAEWSSRRLRGLR